MQGSDWTFCAHCMIIKNWTYWTDIYLPNLFQFQIMSITHFKFLVLGNRLNDEAERELMKATREKLLSHKSICITVCECELKKK